MDERMRFVIRLKDGESMAALCREFGISRRPRAEGTPLSDGFHPNDLLCTDYKGEFQLGDKRYCYPLTVTDYCSRYLLLCEGPGIQPRRAGVPGL